MRNIWLVFLGLLFVSNSWGFDFWSRNSRHDGWDKANNPHIFDNNLVKNFEQLPLNGRLSDDKIPWSETYWPLNRGGIAYRWNSKDPAFKWVNPKEAPNPAIFKIKSPTRAQAMRMTEDEVAQLSPAEKFDLFNGDYKYSLTRKVFSKSSPEDAYWEGICNGWAPASLNHPEPAPVTVVNRDGIRIPFGASDVKGLLSYYYASVKAPTRQIGKRCSLELKPEMNVTDDRCNDVNAGTFHIIVTNFISLKQQGFVADVDRPVEVWNNPVFAYESKIENRIDGITVGTVSHLAPGTVSRVLISTKVLYADDDENFPPLWHSVVGTADFKQDDSEYQYWLDLNAAGEIIGGEWISFDRPDFLWITPKREFVGKFASLSEIYRPAR